MSVCLSDGLTEAQPIGSWGSWKVTTDIHYRLILRHADSADWRIIISNICRPPRLQSSSRSWRRSLPPSPRTPSSRRSSVTGRRRRSRSREASATTTRVRTEFTLTSTAITTATGTTSGGVTRDLKIFHSGIKNTSRQLA